MLTIVPIVLLLANSCPGPTTTLTLPTPPEPPPRPILLASSEDVLLHKVLLSENPGSDNDVWCSVETRVNCGSLHSLTSAVP